MMENHITLVGNYGIMLRETRTPYNDYLIKQLPVSTVFVDKKYKIVHASDKWIADFDFKTSIVYSKAKPD